MVPAQESHAKAILESSANIRDIRFKMCPSHLRDEVGSACRTAANPPKHQIMQIVSKHAARLTRYSRVTHALLTRY